MANQRAIERLGERSGTHFAFASASFSPPDALIPLGFLEKRSWWSGTTNEFRRFVFGSGEDDIDLGASANAAYGWLDQQGPSERVCAVIVDGYFRRGQVRRESLIQRMVSTKDRISTEVFFPYRLARDGTLIFEDPICFIYDIAPNRQPTLADVNIGAFADAIKHGFRTSGAMPSGVLLWGYD